MKPILESENLGKSFGDATVLQSVDLALHQGDRLAIIGQSGSGKTTLLRLIAGLETPSAGELRLQGQIVSTPNRLHVPPERRNIAMVFQGLALLPHLRALDQIAFAARGSNGRERSRQLLDRIGLSHRAAAPLSELSGGERQRIALARALVQRPALLLMDEPFASLDDQKRDEMRTLLRTLLDEAGTTLILVTHARDDVFVLANHVMVMSAGRCVANESLEQVLIEPRHVATAQCLGLGSVVRGRTADGVNVESDIGPVTLSRMVQPGEVAFLIHPKQARFAAGGSFQISAVELRPSRQNHELSRTAVINVNGRSLRIDCDRTAVKPGDRVAIQIDGPCMPLAQH